MAPTAQLLNPPRAPTAAEKEAVEDWCENLKGTTWLMLGEDIPANSKFTCLHWALEVEPTPVEGETVGNVWLANDLWEKESVLIERFTSRGFVRTTNAAEADVDVYQDAAGNTRHFAKKLPDGRWSSKLGNYELIIHDRNAVAGKKHGTVKYHFKRSGTAAATTAATHALANATHAMAQAPVGDGLTQEEEELLNSHTMMAKTAVPKTPTPTKNKTPAPLGKTTPTPIKKTTPAKTTTPKATTPKATPPKATTPPPKTPPKAATPPPKTPPPADDKKLKKDFDTNWAAWLAAQKKLRASDPASRIALPTFAKIKAQGKAVLPFLVENLKAKKESPLCIIAIHAIDPTLDKEGTDFATKKAAILKNFAAKSLGSAQKLSVVSERKSSLIAQGLQGASLAAELMTDPLFQQAVKEGIHAVPNILNAYAKDGAHGKELWIEMLKQIHTIHGLNLAPGEEHKQFEDWLEDHLAPAGAAHQEVEAAEGEHQEEAPAAEAPAVEAPAADAPAAEEAPAAEVPAAEAPAAEEHKE